MVAKYSGLSKVRWHVWTVKRDRRWSKRVCQLSLCIKCIRLEGEAVKAVVAWGCLLRVRVSIRVLVGLVLAARVSYLGFRVIRVLDG